MEHPMHRSAYAFAHHDELAGSLMDQQLFNGYSYAWGQPFDPYMAATFEHEAMPSLYLDPHRFRSSFTADHPSDQYCAPASIQTPYLLDSPHGSNVAAEQRVLVAAQWSAAHAHGRMGSPVDTISSSKSSSSLHAQSRTMSREALGLQSYEPKGNFQPLDNTVGFFQEPEPCVILPSQYTELAPHSPVAAKLDVRPTETVAVPALQMEFDGANVEKEASSDESEPAWPQQDKSDADSDYTPVRTSASKKRSHGGRSRGLVTARVRSKVVKRAAAQQPQLRAAHVGVFASESHGTSRADDYECRSFTCPSRPYGCYTTFTSKNEWKRHVISQHLCLGYWRCDLCPTGKDKCPNDFNRKDLFTQHLRRMHSPSGTMGAGSQSPSKVASRRAKGRSKTTPGDSDFAKEIEQIRKRCWVQARQPPTELECAFCRQAFAGDGTCLEEFLEHVGRHLAVVPSEERTAQDDEVQHQANSITFAKDVRMRDWLARNGLLSRTEGRWELCNPLTTEVPTTTASWGSADAEGDPE